jgi:AGZA family xanthine/uracil permease-like MFS transporter
MSTTTLRYPLFVRRDLDAFFGLSINNLVDLIIIVTIGKTLLHFPDWIIYGRILPGAGISLLVGNLYYAHQAKQLAVKENRTDVTAQPYGINTPTVFIFLYLIMWPVYWRTKDAELAWKVGVAACFLSGLIEFSGSFVGEKIRAVTPRAALLATLAGAAIAFISLIPTLDIFAHPLIGFVPLAVILMGYFARVRFPFNLPAGFLAVLIGAALAWVSGFMDVNQLRASVGTAGLYPPRLSALAIYHGLGQILPYLSIVAPAAVLIFMGTMQCVESAAAAGDRYSTRPTMIVNGLGTIVGACFGSCFPTTVYIGHPAWKALGARRGYSILNGVVITILCLSGLMGLVLAVIPKEAGAAILLFVGLIISAQAFQVTPKHHYPAVALGLVPHIAAWGIGITQNIASAAQTTIQQIGFEAIRTAGLNYEGLMTLGSGSLLSSMMITTITILMIDRKFKMAAGWALVSSGLTFFGFMHAEQVGLGAATWPALGYLLMGVFFLAMSLFKQKPEESPIEGAEQIQTETTAP